MTPLRASSAGAEDALGTNVTPIKLARWRRRAHSKSRRAQHRVPSPSPGSTVRRSAARITHRGRIRRALARQGEREMRAARLLAGFGCLIFLPAVLGGGSAEASWPAPSLLVSPERGEYPNVRLSLSFADERGAPGRIVLFTPNRSRPLSTPAARQPDW